MNKSAALSFQLYCYVHTPLGICSWSWGLVKDSRSNGLAGILIPTMFRGFSPLALPQSPRGRTVGPPVFRFSLAWSQDVRCRVVGLMVDIWPSSGSCPPRHFLWLDAPRTGDASQMTPRFVWPIALIGP